MSIIYLHKKVGFLSFGYTCSAVGDPVIKMGGLLPPPSPLTGLIPPHGCAYPNLQVFARHKDTQF